MREGSSVTNDKADLLAREHFYFSSSNTASQVLLPQMTRRVPCSSDWG